MVERGGTTGKPWLIRFHQPIWLLVLHPWRPLATLYGFLPDEARGNLGVLCNLISVRLEFATIEIPVIHLKCDSFTNNPP